MHIQNAQIYYREYMQNDEIVVADFWPCGAKNRDRHGRGLYCENKIDFVFIIP